MSREREEKTYKQWELPDGCDVILGDGQEARFDKMDGMYAHWFIAGEAFIGNFDKFIKQGDKYIVV